MHNDTKAYQKFIDTIFNMYIIFEEKTSDLPVDGAVDVVIVSSGLKMLINKYLHELIFYYID